MPRENRKRGKKHKKAPERLPTPPIEPIVEIQVDDPQPAISDAPFGYVDSELKSYFKSIDHKLREWASPAEDEDAEQERRLFFAAALSEMRGHELQLATDPDCSVTLEGLLQSMDSFALRVFLDSVSGSYLPLAKHRFGSHVCQTSLQVASYALEESRSSSTGLPSSDDALRSLHDLIHDCVKELSPNINELLSDPFGSHVLRSLFLLLHPSLLPQSQTADVDTAVRSKRSANWKKSRGEYRPLFDNARNRCTPTARPNGSDELLRGLITDAKSILGGNEFRALSVNPVSSPTIQLLLRAESLLGLSEQPGSIMDVVLDGLISEADQQGSSDFVRGLLRDATASHLLESVIESGPISVRVALWKGYFVGQLNRMATHPVANFLVAKFLGHLPKETVSLALEELLELFPRIVKGARSGILISAVARVEHLDGNDSAKLMKALFTSFGSEELEDSKAVLYSILAFRPTETRAEPTTPGAVLAQRILEVKSPFNQPLVDNILSLPVDDLLSYGCDPAASRALDVFLESGTVPHKAKRQLLLNLIGSYHVLAQDRIGSRIVDRCWGFADLYLKEKIARSVLDQEKPLLESTFGKYFLRHLHLPLMRKNPSEWKQKQRGSALPHNGANVASGKRKRES